MSVVNIAGNQFQSFNDIRKMSIEEQFKIFDKIRSVASEYKLSVESIYSSFGISRNTYYKHLNKIGYPTTSRGSSTGVSSVTKERKSRQQEFTPVTSLSEVLYDNSSEVQQLVENDKVGNFSFIQPVREPSFHYGFSTGYTGEQLIEELEDVISMLRKRKEQYFAVSFDLEQVFPGQRR